MHLSADNRILDLEREDIDLGPLVGQSIAYFLVRPQRPARPEVERFAAWLLAEARRTEQVAAD